MKRISALLSAALIILTLAACSGQSDGSKTRSSASGSAEQTATLPEGNTGTKVIDDNSVAGMEFAPPKAFKSANRNIVESVNGIVIEKDMIYILNDESVLKVILMAGTKLDDVVNTDDYKDKVEQDGVTFHTSKAEKYATAYAEKDGNTYIISYTGSSDTPTYKEYDEILKSVHFTGSDETAMNGFDMFDITYETDKSDQLYGYTIAQQEDPKGEIVTKSVTSNYGDDMMNLDYSLRVKVFKNKTVEKAMEEVYSQPPKSEEKTVNGIKYTAVMPKEDSGETQPHSYYTQHGSDTYAVYNDGGGVFEITRSEESQKAFNALLNSISFK